MAARTPRKGGALPNAVGASSRARNPVFLGESVQRLFSMFPSGLPGAGILLVRCVTAVPLILAGLATAASATPGPLELAAAGLATLLLIGCWTPIVGAALGVTQLVLAWSHPADWRTFVHFGLLSAALALLGP